MAREWWKLGIGTTGILAIAAVHVMPAAPPEPIGNVVSGPRPIDSPKTSDSSPLVGRVPTGTPPALSCVAARAIVAQINTQLVQAPEPPNERAYAASVIDWLDPHGLWSAAPGSPAGEAIRASAHALLEALRGPRDNCEVSLDLGRVLARSVTDLRSAFDKGRASAPGGPGSAFESVFEPGEVKRPAVTLAALLGERAGSFELIGLQAGAQLVDEARHRFFPPLTPESWGDVVLAAAVRAYVPAVDPHGAWAPFEEEASLYESELEAKPPPPFWDAISRTPLGVRIDAQPLSPLAVGDLVLSIEGVTLGGMPIEQIEQLAYTLADERQRVSMLVLSPGAREARALSIELPPPAALAATREGLSAERVRYGEGDALVLAIHDVREDLGDEMARELERARSEGPLSGIVLDLRGNGGGSTDGAAAALGLFLPGAPLFAMRRRDGTVEIDSATEPPLGERWNGPLAALVDRSTASAAEMIAGALGAYRRGVVVGERTFGKGCAQEYIEDEADVGVLRLTTLVFSLPDGSPLQRTGLLPSLIVPFGAVGAPLEVEASLPGAAAAFRGPDVRDARRVATLAAAVAWPPPSRGEIGPCKDPDVCRGFKALAAAATKRAAKR